jgi:HEPN domain-containing protein
VTRTEWQQLAERWLADAKALLDARRWSAAYYVAGYAVECGLKACVVARVAAAPELIFQDKRFSEKCWTHSPADLVKVAGLEEDRVAEVAANPAFKENWNVAMAWSEQARYNTMTHHEAKRLYGAITNQANGVMPWIRARW